jgi:hypothetical protein
MGLVYNHWISGLCPSCEILNNKKHKTFWKLDPFPSSGEAREIPTLLGLFSSEFSIWDDEQIPETLWFWAQLYHHQKPSELVQLSDVGTACIVLLHKIVWRLQSPWTAHEFEERYTLVILQANVFPSSHLYCVAVIPSSFLMPARIRHRN